MAEVREVIYGADDKSVREAVQKLAGKKTSLTAMTVTGASYDEVSDTLVGCSAYHLAIVYLDLTTFDLQSGEELDIYVQTSYDLTDYFDLVNIHFDDGDEAATYRIVAVIIGMPADDTPVVTEHANLTDGTLADDTRIDLPLGEALRLRVKGTGTDPDAVIATTVILR